MTNLNIKNLIGLIVLGLAIGCSPKTNSSKSEKVGQTVEVKDKNIDWEAYDATSTVAKTEIKILDLQGLWNAYKGVYRFGDYVNAMDLTKPMIMEVKDDTYRRNSDGAFNKFTLKDNLILKTEETKVDTGIINKITTTELTISWKNNSNYTRYYYKK